MKFYPVRKAKIGNLERFLDLEKEFGDSLIKAWQPYALKLLGRIHALLKQGKYGEASALVDSIDLGFLISPRKVNLVSLSAVMFGASLVAPRMEDIQVKPKEMQDEFRGALELTRRIITQNVTELVRDSLHEMIAGEQAKAKEAQDKAYKDELARSVVKPFVSFDPAVIGNMGNGLLQMTASLHTSRLSSLGFLAEAEFSGITVYAINAQLDVRVCPVCVLEGNRISFNSDETTGVSKRRYKGEAISIELSSGERLSVTPNHPILTSRGWVPAGSLQEGSSVACSPLTNGKPRNRPYNVDGPTLIEEVFDAVSGVFGSFGREVPISPPHFHGDGEGSEVAVIVPNGFLLLNDHPKLQEKVSELGLFRGLLGEESLSSSSVVDSLLLTERSSCDGLGRAKDSPSIFPVSLEPSGLDSVVERIPMDIESALDFLNRTSVEVEFNSVVKYSRFMFDGHVYNLDTPSGYYVAEGIIVHNCRTMHGRVFSVSDGRRAIDTILSVDDPNDLKTLQAWPKRDDETVKGIAAASAAELVRKNWHLPPYHPGPVSEDTEFLSDSGWKLVKDATPGDLAFSLNPDTESVEWVPVKEVVSGPAPNGRMVNMVSQNSDFLVTEHHRQVYRQQLNSGSRLNVRTAGELMALSRVDIPRSCSWSADEIENEDLVVFLALWISDGICIKRSQHSYQIGLCTRKYPELAISLFERLTGKPAYFEGGKVVRCNDEALGAFLLQEVGVGSQGKKIPRMIMEAGPKTIRLFLNSYLRADGSVCSTNGTHGKGVNKTFYTTSPVLAAQIGELIVKAGGFPSYYFQENKGGVIAGREIKSNKTVHRIRWNTSKHATFGPKGKGEFKFVPYDGMTYCLVLERNFIFYMRRGGKCLWTGNCRCLTVQTKNVPSIEQTASYRDAAALFPHIKRYVPNKWDFVSVGLPYEDAALEEWAKWIHVSPRVVLGRMLRVNPNLITRDYLSTLGVTASILNNTLNVSAVNTRLPGTSESVSFEVSIPYSQSEAALWVSSTEKLKVILKDIKASLRVMGAKTVRVFIPGSPSDTKVVTL